jgi:hypothetical protein
LIKLVFLDEILKNGKRLKIGINPGVSIYITSVSLQTPPLSLKKSVEVMFVI